MGVPKICGYSQLKWNPGLLKMVFPYSSLQFPSNQVIVVTCSKSSTSVAMTLCWDVVFFRLDLLISVGTYTNWNHHDSAQRRRLPVLHIILQFGHVHHQGCPFLWRYRKNARKHCVHNGPRNETHKSYQSNQNHTNQIKSSKLSIHIAQHIKASNTCKDAMICIHGDKHVSSIHGYPSESSQMHACLVK